MRTVLVLAIASACAIPDDKTFNNLYCPNTRGIPNEITVTGTITNPLHQDMPFNGAVRDIQVQAMPNGFTAMTDGSGTFSGTLPIAGSGDQVSFLLTGSNYFPSVFFPALDLTANYHVTAEVFLESDIAELASAGITVGSDTQQMIISAVDCLEEGVPGVSINTTPGDVIYLDGSDEPDPTLTATEGLYAAALVTNIDQPNVIVQGSTPGSGFARHTVPVGSGVLTETELAPQQ
ncbi:MAG TPA: hypothetical protein VH143_19975 [Kofleriaceae bacterium]|jgi:hypothetical protein|nr:hypothetical protein [Kofleriaceae bacterium]